MSDTRPRIRGPWSIVLASALAVAVVVAFVLLVILPLLNPPPAAEEPYQFIVSDETVIDLETGQDYLAEVGEGDVAVYIPSSAHFGQASLTLRSRHPVFVPDKSDEEFERLVAVDLFLSDSSGETIDGAAFREPILLCFRLTKLQQEGLRQNPNMFEIQYYAESAGAGKWVPLDPAPGWETGQICSLIDHLSLFALVENLKISGRSTQLELRTPIVTVVPPKIYSLPTETPRP